MLWQRKRYNLAVVLVLAALLVGACQFGKPVPGKEIRLNLGSEPYTADPGMAEGSATQVCELLFLGLTDYDDQTMEVVPELATKWEPSADGLAWTFHLRDDVYWLHYDPKHKRFEKKRPVTAYDVEYAVKRALDAKTASPYVYLLFIIKNALAFNSGQIGAEQVGVKAADDHTVVFTLEEPAAYFPGIAGLAVARPVPQEVIEQYGDRWADLANIWINGPYALESWEPESRMTMIKNPHYFAAGSVSIERIQWTIETDDAEAFKLYEDDKLDVARVPLPEMERVQAEPGLMQQSRTVPLVATYYLGFNQTKAPFDNRLVRQAFSYAVDRQSLIDTVLKGGQVPAKCFAPPTVFGSPAADPSLAGIGYDPEKARRLLAEAGYPGGKGLPEITYVFSTNELQEQIAEFLQQNWKEVLGVEVKLVGEEWMDYYNTITENPPQIFRQQWTGDYPDENNWVLQVFHAQRSQNLIRWQNPEFDRSVEEAAVTLDSGKRKKLYRRAEEILCVDEAAIIPIYHFTRVICNKPYVERTYGIGAVEHIDKWRLKDH